MSTIESLSSYEAVATQQPTYGGSELGQDAFLTLLVTQLQHQDPLEPQKNEEFVAQLAQFSSLEQLTTANSALESLYVAMASMNNASMTQLLGQEVRAYGDTFSFDGESSVPLTVDASHDLEGATLTVTDESGKIIYSEELGPLDSGQTELSWDGSTIAGGTAEAGVYSFSVSPRGSTPEGFELVTIVEGVIDGMSFDTGTPVPSMGGAEINLADIIEVFTPEGDEDEDGDEEQ
jgi:flagellar basal-body rod modification protein FlgD